MSDASATVRDATERDLDGVAHLDAAAFANGWSRDAWADYLGQGNTTIVVVIDAERNDVVVGYACFRAVADEAELLRVAVATTHRRRGWARALLRAGRARLARRGIRTIHLEVRHDQPAAIALYRGEGFRVVGRRPHYYRDPPADAVLMARAPSDRGSDRNAC